MIKMYGWAMSVLFFALILSACSKGSNQASTASPVSSAIESPQPTETTSPEVSPQASSQPEPTYDTQGKVASLVINADYDESGSFVNDLAPVSQDGKWGFIGKDGKLVVQPDYDDAHLFSEGLAAVSKDGKWGFIDTTGSVVVPLSYDDASNFSEGLAAVKNNEGKWGYIDKSGTVAIPFQYQTAVSSDKPGSFHDGLAYVRVGDKYGFIDQKGTVIVQPQFLTTPTDFSEGLAGGITDSGVVYVDSQGQPVVKTGANGYLGKFSGGLAAVMKDNQWGYVDKQGNTIIDYQFADAFDFSEGLAAVKRDSDGMFEYIDQQGQTVIPAIYTTAHDFSEGTALVTKDDAFYGYIDKQGNPLSEFKYNYKSSAFHEGMAAVHFMQGEQDKFGYVALTDGVLSQEKPSANQNEDNLKAFEGTWSSSDANGMKFDLSITNDSTAEITFYSNGQLGEPGKIEIIHDGDQLLYNYVGGDRVTVLKLMDSGTLLFEDADGNQTTLKKQTQTQENGLDQDQVDYWKKLISPFVGEWKASDTSETLHIKIDYKDEVDRGVITFFDSDNNELSDSFRFIELGTDTIMLMVDDDTSSKIKLKMTQQGLAYSITADGELSSGGSVILQKT